MRGTLSSRAGRSRRSAGRRGRRVWAALVAGAALGGALAGRPARAGEGEPPPVAVPCSITLELLTNDIRGGSLPDDLYRVRVRLSIDEIDGPVIDPARSDMSRLAVEVDPAESVAFARSFTGAALFVEEIQAGIIVGALPLARVILFTGDPDPLDPAAPDKAEDCHVFELIRLSQGRATLRHLGRIEVRDVDDDDEVPVEEVLDLLPTAVTLVDALAGGSQPPPSSATLSQTTGTPVAFALAMNGTGIDGENLFEVEIDLATASSGSVHVARPRGTLPVSDDDATAAAGIEGLESLGEGALVVARPVDPAVGQGTQAQNGEVLAFEETIDGGASYSLLGCAESADPSAVSRYDGFFGAGFGLGGGFEPRVTARSQTGPGSVTAPLTTGSGEPLGLGVRSAKDGLAAGLFLASLVETQNGDEEVAATTVVALSCDPFVEDPIVVGADFVASRPEVLGFLFPPVVDLRAEASAAALDANRVAVTLRVVDADGEPLSLLSGPISLDVAVTLASGGSFTITDAQGATLLGEGGTFEGAIEVIFVEGVADRSCNEVQLIVELDGPLAPFELEAFESTTGLTATLSFDPATGALTLRGGGCALDPGRGIAGLLAFAPLAGALAVLAEARRRAARAAAPAAAPARGR